MANIACIDSSDEDLPGPSGLISTATTTNTTTTNKRLPQHRSQPAMPNELNGTTSSSSPSALTGTSISSVVHTSGIIQRSTTTLPNDAAVTPIHGRKRSHPITVATATPRPPPVQHPKKKPKPNKAFTLIWICAHGKGQSRKWRQRDLKVVGVYPTKAAAQRAKEVVMGEHDCCGHGDICVGGTWEDEIDLVVREAPNFI